MGMERSEKRDLGVDLGAGLEVGGTDPDLVLVVADDDLDLALDLEIDEEDIVVTLDLGPEIDEGLVVLGEGVVILEADREAIPEVGLEVTAEAGRDQEVADNQQTFSSI